MIAVYFDFETGGVKPEHPSIQLAAVAYDGSVELGAFEQKIAFLESEADPAALAINHYDRQAWADAKSPGVTASRFAAWLRPYCTITRTSKAGNPYSVAQLAGYNAASFDEPRLRALFGAQFLPMAYPVRDVLQRVVFYFDEHPDKAPPQNFKLTTVCEYFGIAVDGAHDALTDARLCAAVHRAVTL